MRCRGDSIRATKEVEKSISIMAMFPSSLLNILENGSVWNILNPFEVPVYVEGNDYKVSKMEVWARLLEKKERTRGSREGPLANS